jgi:hypothetical protein
MWYLVSAEFAQLGVASAKRESRFARPRLGLSDLTLPFIIIIILAPDGRLVTGRCLFLGLLLV